MRQQVAGESAFAPLVEFLRDDRRLVGTKVGCGEGDCGACTVLLGVPHGGTLRYRPACSCLLSLLQVDAAHVVTVEGLKDGGDLSPVQRAMVEHHGSQCGYCTPGFVVALTGLLESGAIPGREGIGAALAGNLCRCTGYLPILESARAIDRGRLRPLARLYPSRTMLDDLAERAGETLRVESPATGQVYFRPSRLDEAVAFKAQNPGAAVLAGGTEVGFLRNTQGREPGALLGLSGLDGLAGIRRDRDVLSVGARVTWAELEAFANGPEPLPIVAEMGRRFGSPQIRSVATLAGNIAHRSPVADSLCLLLIADAELELAGARGTRRVPVEDFLAAPGRTGIAPDEIIARILIPLPGEGEAVGLYKVSKRKEMDVSTFRAAVRVATKGTSIDRAAIAYAGVGPTARRLRATESFLAGRPFTEETFREAGRRARAEVEVEPVSNARGSRHYRLQLVENILMKFYYEWADARRQENGVG